MSVKLNRIEKEFVFRKLIERKSTLKILFDKKETPCEIIAYSDETLDVTCANADRERFRPDIKIDIFFEFENNYHTFNTAIIKKTDALLVLQQPETVMKSLKRSYERVKDSKDVSISFTIKGKKIELNFPQTENFVRSENPEPRDDFDPASIRRLLIAFRNKMNTTVSENKIIMLRNRVPSTYEEKVMLHTGKIIWIPSMEDGFLAKNIFPEPILLTYGNLALYEEETGTPRDTIENKIKQILQEKLKKGYYSQLYCPAFYNEYMIGYIYLMNTIVALKKIDVQLLKYTYQFSKFLSHSLILNNYFSSQKSEDAQFETPVIDISASGLLFANSDKDLSTEIVLHSSMNITLKILSRKMFILARVSRKFRDTKNFYYGLHFVDITPEDFRYLYEFIYGKPYELDNQTMIANAPSIEDLLSDDFLKE
jgi:hypothetical protein